eukprot:231916-Hanusia_phi.AAC.1
MACDTSECSVPPGVTVGGPGVQPGLSSERARGSSRPLMIMSGSAAAWRPLALALPRGPPGPAATPWYQAGTVRRPIRDRSDPMIMASSSDSAAVP